MRRLFISFALLFAVAFASAQEAVSTDSVAYLEALRMARETSENTSKSLEERKIARFKQFALEYLGTQTLKRDPKSDIGPLNEQALALYKFINAYEYQLTISNKKARQNVIETFKQVSTDWVAAYKEIERIYSAQ